MSEPQEPNTNLKDRYWQYFFTDNFQQCKALALELRDLALNEEQLSEAYELEAKVLLKQGRFKVAQELLSRTSHYSPLRHFIDFLLNGRIEILLDHIYKQDLDSHIFRAQALLFAKIYWGFDYELDLGLEKIFTKLIDEEDFDRAILASLQSLEIIIQEQEFAKDLLENIAAEHLNNLLELSSKAKYQSSKAKIYLLKAKLFKDRQAAEDAEILFGKDANQNGLGEVYALYATEFQERREENLNRALLAFTHSGNLSAQGYIYETLASDALSSGNLQEALEHFAKAEEVLEQGGLFENIGLEIQELSLMALTGDFKNIKSKSQALLNQDIPKLFKAQIAQILANTLVQADGDLSGAKILINYACELLEELNRFQQLLQAKNVLFQVLLLDENFEPIIKLGEEIIQLADRLGDEDCKATKYVDLAFTIVRKHMDSSEIGDKEIEMAASYFNQALEIYQRNNNLLGEADVYQSMGNLFASINQNQEAYNSFKNARDLYKAENALLQCAITDSLIGVLMLDFSTINEQSYKLAHKHLEAAFMYYQKEGLYDLCWKNAYYIANLNEKFYLGTGDKTFKNKARHYYIEMLQAIKEFREHRESQPFDLVNTAGINPEEALSRGADFFFAIKEDEIAREFKSE